LLGLALDDFEGAVDDALGDGLLTGAHDRVHELRNHQVPVFRVRIDLSFLGTVTARHGVGPRSSLCSSLFMTVGGLPRRPYAKRPNHLGRFAPYLERRCLRFFTPCVSSTPRRMW